MSISAIILAAGLSTRMGTENKLLSEVGGRAMVRRVVDAVSQVTDTPPLVVLGHQSAEVADALAGTPVRLMTNPDYRDGQQSSVAFGLQWADPADLTLVALGDQPHLTADNLRQLLSAHRHKARGRITVPMRSGTGAEGGLRGNPIVLPQARLREVTAQGRNLACGRFTRRNPEAVHPWPTARPAFFADVDFPAQLAAARSAVSLQHAL